MIKEIKWWVMKLKRAKYKKREIKIMKIKLDKKKLNEIKYLGVKLKTI